MKLIAIILCLLIERYTNWGIGLRRVAWFGAYNRYMANLLHKFNEGSGWQGFALFLTPILLVALILNVLLSVPLWGLLVLLFNVAVLLHCMPASAYVQPEHDDLLLADDAPVQSKEQATAQAASTSSAPKRTVSDSAPDQDTAGQETAQSATHSESAESVDASKATESAEASKARDDSAMTVKHAEPASALSQAHADVFSVMFWFVLLGFAGALVYWVCRKVQEETNAAPAWARFGALIQPYLDWIPARLSALTFALVGQFVGSFVQWLKHLVRRPADNDLLLHNCANSAIGQEIGSVLSESQVLSLVKRALVVWLVLVALLTLTTWIS